TPCHTTAACVLPTVTLRTLSADYRSVHFFVLALSVCAIARQAGMTGAVSNAPRPALASAEAWLAAFPPCLMRLGLVLAHLQHHEAIGIDQRGVGDVGDVLAAVHRFLDHADGQRRQARHLV